MKVCKNYCEIDGQIYSFPSEIISYFQDILVKTVDEIFLIKDSKILSEKQAGNSVTIVNGLVYVCHVDLHVYSLDLVKLKEIQIKFDFISSGCGIVQNLVYDLASLHEIMKFESIIEEYGDCVVLSDCIVYGNKKFPKLTSCCVLNSKIYGLNGHSCIIEIDTFSENSCLYSQGPFTKLAVDNDKLYGLHDGSYKSVNIGCSSSYLSKISPLKELETCELNIQSIQALKNDTLNEISKLQDQLKIMERFKKALQQRRQENLSLPINCEITPQITPIESEHMSKSWYLLLVSLTCDRIFEFDFNIWNVIINFQSPIGSVNNCYPINIISPRNPWNRLIPIVDPEFPLRVSVYLATKDLFLPLFHSNLDILNFAAISNTQNTSSLIWKTCIIPSIDPRKDFGKLLGIDECESCSLLIDKDRLDLKIHILKDGFIVLIRGPSKAALYVIDAILKRSQIEKLIEVQPINWEQGIVERQMVENWAKASITQTFG